MSDSNTSEFEFKEERWRERLELERKKKIALEAKFDAYVSDFHNLQIEYKKAEFQVKGLRELVEKLEDEIKFLKNRTNNSISNLEI